MAEENKEVVEEGKKQEEGTSGAASAETKNAEKLTIPKDRFDSVNEERKSALARVKELESKEESDAKDALAKQGKFEELYKEQLGEAEKARAELATIRHDSIRRDIATDAGFPQFWNRIQGDDKESLKADMDALAAAMPKAKAPDIDAKTKSGKRTSEGEDGAGKMSKTKRAYYASMLNVSEANLPDDLEDF